MKFEYNFVKKGVFDLPETDWWGFDPNDHIEIQENWTLAHLAVEMELFPSVGQARKNGWDGPIPNGYTEKKKIGKMKKSMFIHNPSDEFINDYLPKTYGEEALKDLQLLIIKSHRKHYD